MNTAFNIFAWAFFLLIVSAWVQVGETPMTLVSRASEAILHE